jgi:regulator of sigma E protease
MVYEGGTTVDIPMNDPTRIPFEMAQAAARRPKPGQDVTVRIEVVRFDPKKGTDVPGTVLTMKWDDSWGYQDDIPISESAPQSIPQLGLAYWIKSTIAEVQPNSPAKEAGLQKGQTIKKIQFRRYTGKEDEVKWTSMQEIKTERPNKVEDFDQWAHYFFVLQNEVYHEIQIAPPSGNGSPPILLQAVQDETWPLTDRGLILTLDLYNQKADTIAEALQLGLTRTGRMLMLMYKNLMRLVQGRIPTKSLGGPIELAVQAFSAARNIWVLIFWLGFISLNLAVVNFLPIPILDGGHMVFLLYEKVRGQPPSETVRAVATYVGLAMIVALMLYVTVQDFIRRVLSLFT